MTMPRSLASKPFCIIVESERNHSGPASYRVEGERFDSQESALEFMAKNELTGFIAELKLTVHVRRDVTIESYPFGQ